MTHHSNTWHIIVYYGIYENMSYLKIVFTIFHTVGEICTCLECYVLSVAASNQVATAGYFLLSFKDIDKDYKL